MTTDRESFSRRPSAESASTPSLPSSTTIPPPPCSTSETNEAITTRIPTSTSSSSSQTPTMVIASNKILVDINDDHRATELKVLSLMRPHMRSFYSAMLCFFVGIMVWFSVSPLQTSIVSSVDDINDHDLFTASMASTAGNFIARVVAGPLCDTHGARRIGSLLLLFGAVVCGLTTLVQTSPGLAIARFFMGMTGATLVVSQYWMTQTFTKDIIGLATGLVLGIGYSGSGLALLILGSGILPLLERHNIDTDLAWRLALIVPTSLAIVTSMYLWTFTDDSPKDYYLKQSQENAENGGTGEDVECSNNSVKNLDVVDGHAEHDTVNKRQDAKVLKTRWERFQQAATNTDTWILFCQYGVSSGGNAAMLNSATLYFQQDMGLSNSSASAISSAVGWLGLSCFVGGWVSDKLMATRMDITGRKFAQFLFLLMGGGLIMLFPLVENTGLAIATFVAFSLFLTLTTGSSFALVAYVNSHATGSVAGIVASGGSIFDLSFLFLLQRLQYKDAFMTIGAITICMSFLTALIRLPRKAEPAIEIEEINSNDAESDDGSEV